MNLSFTGNCTLYRGDEKTGKEIATILGNAINKNDLQWMIFSDEQFLDGAVQAGLPHEVAKNYAEMGGAIRSGEMSREYLKDKPELSNIKLSDFANEFASVYNG